jgi:putative transposase
LAGAFTFDRHDVDGLKVLPGSHRCCVSKNRGTALYRSFSTQQLELCFLEKRKQVAADLRTIYQSVTVAEAEQRLDEFDAKWRTEYPAIIQSWHRHWSNIITFFDYPPEIRKVVYTTNAIESINMSLRKISKNRSSFPTDEAVMKLFYLAIRNISKKWTMPIQAWKASLNRFSIQFDDCQKFK